MKMKTSLDWDPVHNELMRKADKAPVAAQIDLHVMLMNIRNMVSRLSQEEVRLRQLHKESSSTHDQLLVEIEQAIDEYDKWVMMAYLLK